METGLGIVKTPKVRRNIPGTPGTVPLQVEELSVLEELLTEAVTSKEPAKVALTRVNFTK